MATSSEKVALRLNKSAGGGTDYFRFNVERGLEDVTLADWERTSQIAAHTRNYLAEREKEIQRFGERFHRTEPLDKRDENGRVACC